jgi:hypothetical protein
VTVLLVTLGLMRRSAHLSSGLALLIAFAFGALPKGVAGGGAPAAFGGLGNPLIILGRLTGPILYKTRTTPRICSPPWSAGSFRCSR